MSVLLLATVGGLISFLSTSLGALLSLFSKRSTPSSRFSLSIDFALGLMVSASAFTLIGPAAMSVKSDQMLSIVFATIAGATFIYVLKSGVHLLQNTSTIRRSHLLLATALMVHNFPEGLASGAALAGLGWKASAPILGGIALQNIPEGALMVLCLRTLGVSFPWALMGGIGSGLVELSGGVFSGFLLDSVTGILPLLLSAAGGAMLLSVMIELLEGEEKLWARVRSSQFAMGLLCLPMIQLISF